ncbi:MAG: ATP-binding protein [Haliscomenobacter sp.]|uniref:ATP-dependent nuclease n=1 Tax=Haliscomenobacter sp. TaxID=2717303 RepID=UPI0029ABD3E0|nr:ATP-binding protein [Haliscomenobacter sp.]MDX2072642.1 ATP-binding protein [Haliscomenobacter sp.]
MKIKDIKIKGWRSFDLDNGISLQGLRRMNILIGPNNSGKSNIGKYFFWIKELLNNKQAVISGKGNQYEALNNVITTIDNKETWAWEENSIECELVISTENKQWSNGEPFFPIDKSLDVTLKAMHNFKNKKSFFSVFNGDKPLVAISDKDKPQVLELSTSEYIDFNKDIPSLMDTLKYWTELSSCIVFIDPIRHHARSSSLNSNKDSFYYYDGSETLDKLLHIQNTNKKNWLSFETKISTWLEDLLDERIEFRIENNVLTFRLQRNAQTLISTFNEIGTGVSQLFMILSFLYLNKDKDLIVFIDEPESNLHPDAVKRLIHLLEHNFTNHSFFITTHSSALIDQVSADWSIHRVLRKKDLPSQIFKCNTLVSKYEILDDLGIRASQILQSNLVIWVEGPSDRIYLNHWLKDICKTRSLILEEGKHYSFLMYGGANLNSHTILSDDNEDIDILCTSRYSVIICDSDYKNQEDEVNSKLKERVKQLLKRFELIKSSELGENKKIEDYIKIWITEGRETENYIPKELFYEVLSNTPFKKTSIKEDNRVNLVVNYSLIEPFDFTKYDSFDAFFAKMYEKEGGSILSFDQQSKIALKYSNNKVNIAKEIVKKWADNHYSGSDLKNKINQIIDFILEANGKTLGR